MKNYLHEIFYQLDKNSKILDVGCLGFKVYHKQHELIPGLNATHFGVDYLGLDSINNLPNDYNYSCVDLNLNSLPYQNDTFDLVVANHIIEHLKNPIAFYQDLLRVLKPGGKLYLECPSEISVLLPGMFFNHEYFFSLSFYDDPTHTFRPYSPQSLFRLTSYFSCYTIKTGRYISWRIRFLFPFLVLFGVILKRGSWVERAFWYSFGWVSYIVAQKPKDLMGSPQFIYYIPSNRK